MRLGAAAPSGDSDATLTIDAFDDCSRSSRKASRTDVVSLFILNDDLTGSTSVRFSEVPKNRIYSNRNDKNWKPKPPALTQAKFQRILRLVL